ncbi:branched-chain amino acid ABC transporter permease [Aquabacterium sp.]|uniref:branched-chain amino acid ABC transporter permease n=1 Tax=Aquabacterium sp. TaxID=1872578 RepID=UPI002BB50101|nr:branched-chain amino acid ABC transporter permease [Aquabacterium sp.]HSW07307.1 branched-chain amino acid ABC transporter permease [Aquabacterium sp.]
MPRVMPWLAAAACLLAAVFTPRFADGGTLRLVAEVLLGICMAQMWNLMAGYTGLLSLGHQIFVGIGAYTLFEATQRLGLPPYWLLPLSGVAGAAAAALLAPALFRLREAYFSIGLWVFAEIATLVVSKMPALGSTAGRPLDISKVGDVEAFQALSFWIACAIGAGALIGVYALMRSRLGLAMLTVRDNELAAGSIGVDIWWVRFPALVASGFGCGIAGAAYFMGSMFVSPDSAFDINWVVMMMFATLIGGIGTLEGPVIGVLVWFALRELLSTWLGLSGGWYLIAMGAVAMAVSLYAPRGLWGVAQRRFGWAGWSVKRLPPRAEEPGQVAAARR